jgi:hypothetical protein
MCLSTFGYKCRHDFFNVHQLIYPLSNACVLNYFKLTYPLFNLFVVYSIFLVSFTKYPAPVEYTVYEVGGTNFFHTGS